MTIDLTPTKAASTTKNVNLNVNGLVNPGTPSAATDAWGKGIGSYIYFGTYPQSDKNGTTKYVPHFALHFAKACSISSS